VGFAELIFTSSFAPLASVALPAEASQLANPSCLAPPRRVGNPNVNGWLNFAKK